MNPKIKDRQKNIKQDPGNYRKHGDKNRRIIKKSLDELGAGRSILTDSEDVIIAGNGVAEQWGDRPVKVIESDGTELIVVKRTDLKTDDKKRKKLALVDNHASDTSEFDFEIIKGEFEPEELEEMEIDIPGYALKKVFENDSDEFDPEEKKFPVTFFTTKQEYSQWSDIKDRIGIDDDTKALFYLIKENILC